MITITRLSLMVIIISIFVLVIFGCSDNTELIDKLTTDNDRLQADVTQLTIGLAGVQANLRKLEVERDGLKEELSSLQEELSSLQGDQDDVIEERDRLKKEIGVLNGKIAEVKKLIAREKDLEKQKSELEEKMALIPAGSFEMGDSKNEPEDWMKPARPVHRVELDAFYMDAYEVTVGQFKQFVEESGYAYNRWQDVAKYSPGDDYPMIWVTWHDATAYAKWAGKRLPTEAEWEYAARGGLNGKRYPWGDDITHDDANYAGAGGKDKWGSCAPVGSFAANGYGLYDMAGNVWEWCSDWYGSDYYSKSPLRNPQGPSSGSTRVVRGGFWRFNPDRLRAAFRGFFKPTVTGNTFGFRCVSGF